MIIVFLTYIVYPSLDMKALNGPTFADRRPLPPHPFEASFTEKKLTNPDKSTSRATERLPVLRGLPSEASNDIERELQPLDKAAGTYCL